MDSTINNTQSTRQRGVVSAHPKGFGFITTEALEEFFVPPSTMRELMPGDIVEFTTGPGKKPDSLQVTSALVAQRPESVWQGTLRFHRGKWLLEPDEPCFTPITVQGLQFACEGLVVSVRVPGFEGTARRSVPVKASLERVLGERTRPGFDLDYALARFDFDLNFTEEAMQQARAEKEPLAGAPCPQGREDLRDIAFVTIDGESTRDFDDAVFAQQTPRGWRVVVAIADVSFYVPAASALDMQARRRTTSVYLPGKTLPMLPEELSNGVCSLVPGQDRYAVVLELQLDAGAKVLSSRVCRGVVRSAQRLTYGEVMQWREGSFVVSSAVQPSLEALWTVYERLSEQRRERGRLEFDDVEPKVLVSEDGSQKLDWAARTDAHKLVEELMLLANMSVASLLNAAAAALFRHQPSPQAEDWEQVTAWAASRGVELPAQPSMRALADFTAAVPPEDTLKASLQARSGMKPASYDPVQPGHFSLGYGTYTHFTSPIRRYADLVVHRLLLAEGVPSEQLLALLAAYCSKRSRDGRMAERLVWDKIKKRLMYRDVNPGSVLDAHVVSQSRRGLRAVVAQWQASVLVSAEDLLECGMKYDDAREAWVNGEVVEPGTRLSVRLMRLEEDRARTEVHASIVQG